MQITTASAGYAGGKGGARQLSERRGPPAAMKSSIAWIPAAAISVAGLAFFLLFVATGYTSDLQCAGAFMITAVPFWVAAAEAPNRLLHPLSVFGFTMLLGVAGQTVYLTHTDTNTLPDDLLSGLTTSILTPGLLVVGLGVVALTVGYLVMRPNRSPRPGSVIRRGMRLGMASPSPDRAFWVVVAACAVSLAAFAVYAPKVGINSPTDLLTSQKRFVPVGGRYESVLGYYRFAMSFAAIGFIFAVYTLVRRRLSWASPLGAVAVLALVLTAGYAVITSSRTQLFAPLAIAVLITVALRRREPRRGRMIIAVLVALFGLSLLGGIRAVNSGQAPSLSSTTRSQALVENAIGSREWMAIGPISVLVNRVPSEYPYQYGKTLVSILWAPIPHGLWPNKPPTLIGPVISPKIFGFTVDRRTGDPPGIIAELWLNGSVIAVLIGMAILGALMRGLQ